MYKNNQLQSTKIDWHFNYTYFGLNLNLKLEGTYSISKEKKLRNSQCYYFKI